MPLSDDIAAARASGVSDADILAQYTDYAKQYAPDRVDGITQAVKDGDAPTKVLDDLAAYDSQFPAGHTSRAGKHTVMDLVKAPFHGLGEELEQHGATATDLGATGIGGGLTSAGQGIQTITGTGPGSDYQPAHFDWHHPIDTIGDLPQAMLEGAASTGGYMAAGGAGASLGADAGPWGAAAGGIAGMGLYGLSRYLGITADQRAANNNRATTAQDVLEAVPGAAARAAIDTATMKLGGLAGGKPLASEGVGADALIAGGKDLAKDAAINGAGAAASNAAGQIATSAGTTRAPEFSYNDMADAAAQGAVTGGGFRLVQSIPGITGARAHVDGDVPAMNNLADLINSNRVAGDPTDATQRVQVLKSTKAVLDGDIKSSLADANAANTEQVNEKGQVLRQGGQLDDQLQVAKDALANLNSGSKLDPEQVQNLKDSLGGNSDTEGLLNNILMRNELNRIGADMNISLAQGVEDHSPYWARTTMGLVMHALRRPAHTVGILGAASAAAHALPGVLGSIALPVGVMALARLGDRIRGNPDRLSDFVQRFGSAPDITNSQPQPQQPTPAPAPSQVSMSSGPMEASPSGPPQPVQLHPSQLYQARAKLTLAQMQAAAQAPAARPAPPAQQALPGPQEVPQAATDALRARMAAVAPQAAQTAPTPAQAPTPSIMPNGPIQGTRGQVTEGWNAVRERAEAVIKNPESTPEQIAAARLARMTAVRNMASPELQRTPLPQAALGTSVSPVAQQALQAPEVQAAIANPQINNGEHVPYVAGASTHSTITNVDSTIPPTSPSVVDRAGNQLPIYKYLNIHEQVEKHLMEQMGLPYKDAHVHATGAERAALEADGGDWGAYSRFMDGHAAYTEHTAHANMPADLKTGGIYPANEQSPGATDMPDGYHVQLSNGQVFQAHADTRISKEARVAATLKRHAGEMSKLEGIRGAGISEHGQAIADKHMVGWQHEAAHNTKNVGEARALGERIVSSFHGADAAAVKAHLEAPDENGGNFYSNYSKQPGKITKSREEAGRAVGLTRAKAKAAKHNKQ